MKSWRTTFFGFLAAVCLWLNQDGAVPAKWVPLCRALGALGLALLGLHAQDCPPNCRGRVNGVLLHLLLLGGVVCLLGCAFNGFKFSLSAPPFGEVGLDIRGGALGKGAAVVTNAARVHSVSVVGVAPPLTVTNAP
jgi:hypothetical protein